MPSGDIVETAADAAGLTKPPLLVLDRVRAFLGFAAEEAKHIHLFKRFREEFRAGFGTECDVIGPADAVAKAVLAHTPLAVALMILHIEWMTQRHFTESVRDEAGLDPQFKSLLRHHWMEEAQHAKLDTLMVESIAARCTPAEIEHGVSEYLKIGMLIDGGLEAQTKFDLAALEKVTGRKLSESQSRDAYDVQRQANRWTYLGSGMTHPNFLATLGGITPAGHPIAFATLTVGISSLRGAGNVGLGPVPAATGSRAVVAQAPS